jgi:hypothetical protein
MSTRFIFTRLCSSADVSLEYLTKAITVLPSTAKRLHKAVPVNPVAPVKRIFICLYYRVCGEAHVISTAAENQWRIPSREKRLFMDQHY